MTEPAYRIVLTGEIANGHSREAVIAALGRLFEQSAAEIARKLSTGACQVGAATTAEEALSLQHRLEETGARVRVDRLTHDLAPLSARLHLPMGIDPTAAGLMHCPACGHKQLVAKRCDECGVVFADYNRKHPSAARKPAKPPTRPAHPPVADINRPNMKPTPQIAYSDWLDDDPPTEQYHVKLFMGLRSAHLVNACERMTLGKRVIFRPSWAWSAVFSPFLWALHRKMYGWSFVIFVVEIFVPGLMVMLGIQPGISGKLTYAGIGLFVLNRAFWPGVLKYIYCRHARGMVAYLNRMSPTFASDIDIATRGGASRTSLFSGAVLSIVFMMLSWSVVDGLHHELMESKQAFTVPPPIPAPAAPGTQRSAPTPTNLQDDRLVNQNKWVATRSKLRIFGQRVNAWLVEASGTVDPSDLDIEQIATALGADNDTVTDGWGNKIRFDSDETSFRLISSGPDGTFSSSDDVEYRRLLRR